MEKKMETEEREFEVVIAHSLNCYLYKAGKLYFAVYLDGYGGFTEEFLTTDDAVELYKALPYATVEFDTAFPGIFVEEV